jgi:hypothetical protein
LELFKSVLSLINRKEHLTIEGLRKIVSIKASMNTGLSDVLKADFPDITLVPRPLVHRTVDFDLFWVSGFVQGEGSFWISLQKKR